jgi:CHAD domain-containing protein
MGTALTDVTDVDSAQAALPKLEDMATQLDTLGKAFQSLPSTARPALAQTVATAVKKLESQRQRIEEIPGVGGILKSILDTIFEKLAAMVKG